MASNNKTGFADKLKSSILGLCDKSSKDSSHNKQSSTTPAPTSSKPSEPATSAPTANMASSLTKVKLIHNTNYKASGPKSYVYLLRRWGFTPTKEGPYIVGNRVHQQGKHFPHSQHTIGGRARVRKVLEKKAASGETGEVGAEDVQNDSEYLAQVQIGTPAQTLNLDFDTGSADLWYGFFPHGTFVF